MSTSELQDVLLGDLVTHGDNQGLVLVNSESYRFQGVGCVHAGSAASRRCAVLEALDLTYNADFCVLIDPKNKVAILSGNDAVKEYPLLNLTNIMGKRAPGHDSSALTKHLNDNFDLHAAARCPKTLRDAISTRGVVPAIVDGLDPPLELRQCEACGRSYEQGNGLSKHKSRSQDRLHKSINVGKTPKFWGVRLFGSNQQLLGFVAKVSCPPPPGHSPPLSVPDSQGPAPAPSLPPYIQQLGWAHYLQMQPALLGNLQLLLSSISPPLSSVELRTRALNWSNPDSRLEILLAVVRRAFVAYVDQAEHRLLGAHPDLRAAVTHGSVLSTS